MTTQQALNVADQALQDAAGSIKILTGLTDTLADSLGGAQGAFTSVTQSADPGPAGHPRDGADRARLGGGDGHRGG